MTKVEISHRTIIFTVALLLALWLIVQIRDILFLIFISFILMAAIRPLVDRLERFRIPRLLAILLIYAVVFGLFGFGVAGTIPKLVTQSTRLIAELPAFVARVMPYWDVDIGALTQQIAPLGQNVLRVTVGIFSNLITTLTVLVFTFYFLLERRYAEVFLSSIMGTGAARAVMDVLRKIEKRLGAWVHGELLLMFFVGLLVYVGLSFLRIDFALPLAIISGLLEIVPVVGPIISAVPAILVAISISPLLAFSVVALYFIVQQVENNLLVPFVMKKSVGLSPLITIFALMLGARLAGLVGAVLAVPMVLVLQEVVGAYMRETPRSPKAR